MGEGAEEGAGRSALEVAQEEIASLLAQLDGPRVGPPGRARLLARLGDTAEAALGMVERGEIRPEERARLASRLFELGEALQARGELHAAVKSGFGPFCRLDASGAQRTLEALLHAAKCHAGRAERHARRLRGAPGAEHSDSLKAIVLGGLDCLRQLHVRVAGMHTVEEREEVYWLVFNAVVVCLSLSEPMASLGCGGAVAQHVAIALVSMESLLPLCVVKFLPWRARLYALLSMCLEREGNRHGARKTASRFLSAVRELRLDEQQVQPVPSEVKLALDLAENQASAMVTALKFRDLLAEGQDNPPDLTRSAIAAFLNDELNIDLDGNALTDAADGGDVKIGPRLQTLLACLTVPGTRTAVRQDRSAVACGFSAPEGQQIAAQLRAAGPQLAKACSLCFELLPEDVDPELQPTLMRLAMGFFHLEQWEPVGELLRRFSLATALSAHATEQVALLQALYLLQCPKPDISEVGLTDPMLDPDGEGTREKALIEGKHVPVSYIKHLAGVVHQCATAVDGQLRKADPDLLLDAAHWLWSPFCTAMLDSLGQESADAPASLELLELAMLAISSAHEAFTSCRLEDATLCAMVSLRLALLHSSAGDGRQAIQVLRHSLRTIKLHQAANCMAGHGLPSLSVCDRRLVDDPERHSTIALASVQADSLALLFRLELEQSAIDKHGSRLARAGSARRPVSTVESTERQGNEITIALARGEEVPEALAPMAATEQRLLAECRKNKGAKALALATICSMRAQNAYEDKAKMLQNAVRLLEAAANDEEALVAQARLSAADSFEAGTGAESRDAAISTGHAGLAVGDVLTPAPPRIVARSCSAIVVDIVPLCASQGGPAPSYYVLYGKPAGSGTEVSLTNTDLTGTGIRQTPDDLRVAVCGLQSNEAYVFAVAAYDARGELVGDSIGATSMEVQTASPLPLELCWGMVAKLAYDSLEHVFHNPKRVFAELHRATREKLDACIHLCNEALDRIVRPFVVRREIGPLYACSVTEDLSLDRSKVLGAGQATVQAFVRAVLLQTSMLGRLGPGRTIAGMRAPTTIDAAERADVVSTAFHVHLRAMEQAQYLVLALHASCMLDDASFVQRVACEAFQRLLPTLETRKAQPRVLQVLVAIQRALCSVPPADWNEAAVRTYSLCSFQVLRLSEQYRQNRLPAVVFLAGARGWQDQGDVWGAEAEATALTPMPRLVEQRALEEMLLLELGDQETPDFDLLEERPVEELMDLAPRALLTQICVGAGAGEYAAASASEGLLAKLVLLCVSKARRSRNAAYIRRAWDLLDSPAAKSLERHLELVSLVGKVALGMPSCSSEGVENDDEDLFGSRVEDSQQWLWEEPLEPDADLADAKAGANADVNAGADASEQDVERQGALPRAEPLVRDVLGEEMLELDEPIEATAARAYPISTVRDPLQFSEVDEYDAEMARRAEEAAALAKAAEEEMKATAKARALQAGEQEQKEGGEVAVPVAAVDSTEMTDEVVGETEEERLAREMDEKAERETAARVALLRRQRALVLRRLEAPTEGARKQLLALAELELLRALEAYKHWLSAGWDQACEEEATASDPAQVDPLARFVDGVFPDGPRTDLCWRLQEGPSDGAGLVPPLKPLTQIQEGVGRDSAARVARDPATVKLVTRALQSTPLILQLCARGMVRARWAHCWATVQRAGKVLWNALEFARVTPANFVDGASCEQALVKPLRISLAAAQGESENEVSARGNGGAKDSSPPAKGVDSARSKGSGEEEETAAPQLRPEGMRYDWRPIFRAACAVLDMMEVVGTTLGEGGTAKYNAAALLKCGVDVRWCATFVRFGTQVLCHLQRWPELVSVASRLSAAVEKQEQHVGPVVPLMILAQRKILDAAELELAAATSQVAVLDEQWQQQQAAVKKRRKERKARASSVKLKVEGPSEAEQEYATKRDELEQARAAAEERASLLRAKLDEVLALQEVLHRDKSTCDEALEKARMLRQTALIEHARPEEASLSMLAPFPGIPTKRSRSTHRSSRSKAPSVKSKAQSVRSRVSRMSRRTKGQSDALSVLTKHTERTPDEDADDGLKGAMVRAAVAAYTSATQLMRQKQENTKLVETLWELGDLHACEGGRRGLELASRAWNDGLDAFLRDVDSVGKWRDLLEGLAASSSASCKAGSASGLGNQSVLESPELVAGQVLVGAYGLLGCIHAGLCAGKLVAYASAGSMQRQLDMARLAAHLLSSLVCCGPPNPTRFCDFALFEPLEVYPVADEAVLFSSVRHDALVDALSTTARTLSLSPCSRDQLVALPLLCVLEYLGGQVVLSHRLVLESRLLRARLLVKLGLLGEASQCLRAVLAGSCLPLSTEEIVKLSGEVHAGDEPEEASAAQASALAGLHVFRSDAAPWSESNESALRAMLDESTVRAMPYVRHLLGPTLLGELALARLELVQRALQYWPPRDAESDAIRTELLSAAEAQYARLEETTREARVATIQHDAAGLDEGSDDEGEGEGEGGVGQDKAGAENGAAGSAREAEGAKSGNDDVEATARCLTRVALARQERQATLGRARLMCLGGRFEDAVTTLTADLVRDSLGQIGGSDLVQDGPGQESSAAMPPPPPLPKGTNDSAAIMWWLETRATKIEALMELKRYEEALAVSRRVIAECKSVDEVNICRRALLSAACAEFKQGCIEEASQSLDEALEIVADPDALRAELLLAREDLARERARLEGAERGTGAAHLEEAVQLFERELVWLAFRPLPRLVSQTSESLYLRQAEQACAARAELGRKLVGANERLDEALEALEDAVQVGRRLPRGMAWLSARASFDLGRCRAALGCPAGKVFQAHAEALGELAMEGFWDLALARDICLELGFLAAQASASSAAAVAAAWLRVAYRLGQSLAGIAELPGSASLCDLDEAAETEKRKAEMAPFFFELLASEHGPRALLFYYLSIREEPRFGLERSAPDQLASLHRYLRGVLTGFEAKLCVGEGDFPPHVVFGTKKSEESAGDDTSHGVAASWVDNPEGERIASGGSGLCVQWQILPGDLEAHLLVTLPASTSAAEDGSVPAPLCFLLPNMKIAAADQVSRGLRLAALEVLKAGREAAESPESSTGANVRNALACARDLLARAREAAPATANPASEDSEEDDPVALDGTACATLARAFNVTSGVCLSHGNEGSGGDEDVGPLVVWWRAALGIGAEAAPC